MINMNRVIKIYYNDLTGDCDDCAELINSACCRQRPLRVAGLLSGEDFFLVTLEDCDAPPRKYNFAALEGGSADELTAEITSRYFAGFTLEGGFLLRGVYWALLSSEPKPVTGSKKHA